VAGAGVGQLATGGARLRWFGPVAVAAGILGELYVVKHDTTGLGWVEPLLVVAGIAAGALLVVHRSGRVRVAAIAVAVAALVAAPATWAAQTLGHATDGTFPAGGPAEAGMGGGPGGGGRGTTTTPGAGGGGMFGGGNLTQVLAYVDAHGGGTLGVSSQSGAGSAVLAGADVAGIGGFSGRESEVSAAWLAEAVRDGRIRWVLTSGGGPGGPGGFGADSRTGSRTAMAAVASACAQADTSAGTLYDCRGRADALAAAG
jgi:hypothetical protein